MVTVQLVVRHELERKPLLLDMFQQGLLNVNAVAEQLQPKVVAALRKDVKLAAVGMAIRRIATEFSKQEIFRWRFPADLEISTKANIYEVAIKRESSLPELLSAFRKTAKKRTGVFLSVVDGTYETVFLTNQGNKNLLKLLLRKYEITNERDNLGYVTVNFEHYTKDIPGIYYQITRALAFNNISIQSFHTIGAEMLILFSNKDLLMAHQVLTGLISGKSSLWSS